MRLNPVKLRTLMFLHGVTQTELAKKTSISRNTISCICNGKSCRATTAHAIATILKVDLDELIEGQEGLLK